MQISDLYARIVAAETQCPGCAGTGHGISRTKGTCPDCSGTGKVAVLPLLREPCFSKHYGGVRGTRGGQWRRSCTEAGCPGWQAKPLSFKTVLKAVLKADILRDHHGSLPYFAFERNERDNVWVATLVRSHGHEHEKEGNTLTEALLGATAKAIGAEVKA